LREQLGEVLYVVVVWVAEDRDVDPRGTELLERLVDVLDPKLAASETMICPPILITTASP
jgi:hypothetical protein